jgi:hypothetical protein
LLVGALLISASPALAQQEAVTSGVVYRLPAKTRVQGTLLQTFCEKTLRMGDTISAKIGPERGTVHSGQRWPKEVVLLLRRRASSASATDPRVAFEIISAKANGIVTTTARGIIVVEPESGTPNPSDVDDRCYDHGVVFGQLSRELRLYSLPRRPDRIAVVEAPGAAADSLTVQVAEQLRERLAKATTESAVRVASKFDADAVFSMEHPVKLSPGDFQAIAHYARSTVLTVTASVQHGVVRIRSSQYTARDSVGRPLPDATGRTTREAVDLLARQLERMPRSKLFPAPLSER